MNSCSVQSSLRRLLPFLLPVIGAALVLLALNIFQYFQVKSEVSSTLVQGIAFSDLREIRSFFKNFELKLKIVREWGKNGVLDIDNVADLNRKFMPFLQETSNITGILMADTHGREYYLMSWDGKTLTRTIDLRTDKKKMNFREWKSPEESVKSWQEDLADYDPRTRPWFRTDLREGNVYFSPIYKFYHSGQNGITASVSWHSSADPAELYVVGLDIHVDDIRNLLTYINTNRKTCLFLVNAGNATMLTGSTPSVGEGASGQIPDEVLKLIIGAWKDAGRPAATPVDLMVGKQRFLASLQPVNPDNPTVWVGVAASEAMLLSSINSSLVSFGFTDFLVVLAGALVLLAVLFRYRHVLHGGDSDVGPEARVAQCLKDGESNLVEFKSTIRTNLQTGKTGKEIELAWLKAVVAFLNTQGGTLLIGVNDDAEVVGLATDDFASDDKCLLHLKNCLHQHIGAEYSQFISVTLVNIDDGQVVLVEVKPAATAAFLKIGKNEEFYIRSGPSSTKLAPSQIVAYVTQKQKE